MPIKLTKKRWLQAGLVGICTAAMPFLAEPAAAQQQETTPATQGERKLVPEMRGPSLESAFNHMYRLKFAEAHSEIAAYQALHPNDIFAMPADSTPGRRETRG